MLSSFMGKSFMGVLWAIVGSVELIVFGIGVPQETSDIFL